MSNNNTRKRKKKTENDIEPITITRKNKKKEPSIIYFAILCHGQVNITKTENDEYKPINIKMPPKISFFNKITFTPFGIYNMMHDEDNKIIFNKLKKEIPKLNTEEGYGEILVDKLKNKYSHLLDDPVEDLKIETDPRSRVYFHMLNNNRDQFYQSVIYDNNTNKSSIPIIQKKFTLDKKVDNNGFEDILVVFEKGGSLNTGDKILNNNNIFKDYMIHLWEKKITNNIDKDGNYIYTPEITTDELLNIAVEYGYEKVVIIDYSCDSCENVIDPHTKIPRNEIIKWREDVKKRLFARGGKYKKRKTLKLRKNGNVKNYTKN